MPPTGSTMSYWIALVLMEERERAGLSERQIATSFDVNPRTIQRLEKGASMGRDIDRFVAGYAHLLGYEDARDLWAAAVKRWRSEGSAPAFSPVDGPPSAFADAIRQEALRRRKPPNAPGKSAKRRANH